MNFPHYREFYPKVIMPIGMNDIANLKNSPFGGPDATHWLIALQEEHLEDAADFCHWKVLVYTSDNEGSFTWDTPYYASPVLESIDSAIELAQEFESSGKSDKLSSLEASQKIS